ncbi:MAG: transglycosylase domain-containing protein [Oscillospiraceae bacterium]|nr:transglycosylase domain-containing protein [Oscillospiraceae bacterium]
MNKQFKLNELRAKITELASKLKEGASKPKTKKMLKTLGKSLLTIFLVCVLTVCIVTVSIVVIAIQGFESGDFELAIDKEALNYTSIVYGLDEKGEYVECERIWAGENRIWVDYDKIPQDMKDAVVAVEDRRFLDHNGVDWGRTVYAFANMFFKFYDTEFGASTITQQLVKNLTGENQHRIDRKIKEILTAVNLEQNYSKPEILEAYLNVMPLDQNLNGVQAAAKAYFNKDVSELSLAECASLAAITQHPTKYGPFRSEENNKERRNMILGMMLEQEMITQEEYDNAINAELVFTKEQFKSAVNSYQSYYVDQVMVDVIDDLVEKNGYQRSYAREVVTLHGIKIYTPMDIKMQNALEEQFETMTAFPKVSGAVSPQSAMAIVGLDGRVQAMVGGLGEKKGDLLFNRATSALRQPGSTMKPISIYGLAIEKDLINWSTIMTDKKIELSDGTIFSNYYNGYLGNMPVEYALQRSVNTIPVQLSQTLTPRESFNFLTDKLGITSLVSSRKVGTNVLSDINLSPMSLGGLTDGISPLELAAAYQVFANGGYYNKPVTYLRVEDSEGNVILEKESEPERVISEETAVIMNKMLQRVCTGTYGTGRAAKLNNMPTGGKTGTTNDKKDIWFVGLTPYNVSALWYGYDTPKTLTGINVSTPSLWKRIMTPVMAGKPTKEFIDSPNVVECTYCLETGKLASSICTKTEIGYYDKDKLPSVCDSHNPSGTQPAVSSEASSQTETSSTTESTSTAQ